MRNCLLLLLVLTVASPLAAHELQSVALRLDELPAGWVQLTMKTPLARDGAPVTVVPQFLPGCNPAGEARVERQPRVVLREWRMHCAGGLPGRQIRIDGLDPRTPDVVVTVRFADGRQLTAVADRHDPVLLLQARTQAAVPPGLLAYLAIGIEHILLGMDHLLFVFGLMLVVFVAGHGWRELVVALTGFTLAHSLTLALAVLGIWGLPGPAIELLIALSIVLLALELARYPSRQARGLPPSLTLRMPWLVAFAFGLLHGFGFAGALAAVGLPEQARGWALFLFNVGVEVGQLVFVAAVLLAWAALRRTTVPASGLAMSVPLLGGVATYWTLDRLLQWSASLWTGA